MQVDKHRKGHGADGEHHDGEQETDAAAHDDERPAGGRGENLPDELRDRGWHGAAIDLPVDDESCAEPQEIDHTDEDAQRQNADGWPADDVIGVLPGDIEAQLAPPADLVEADRGQGTDESESGEQGKDEHQRYVSGCDIGRDQRGKRIDHDQDEEVAGFLPEIIDAFGQSVHQVSRTDLLDLTVSGAVVYSADRSSM